MKSLIPTKDQWRKWSKPTKYQLIGMLVSVASLALAAVALLNEQRHQAEPGIRIGRSYSADRVRIANQLGDASLCLSARLHHDSVFPIGSECQANVAGLHTFFRAYAAIFANIPYSGAKNLQEVARWTEGEVEVINSLATQDQLMSYQRSSGINLAQVAYYLCGFERYIRLGPPNELPPPSPETTSLHQSSWTEWNLFTGAQFSNVPFSIDRDGKIDDPGCASFIEVLD